MDKCLMTADDVLRLFEWRDRNKDLVRRGICPVKAIEIIIDQKEFQQRIKCVRKDDELTIYHTLGDVYKCKYKLEVIRAGAFVPISIKPSDNDEEYGKKYLEDIAGLYFALMALMAYGDDVEYTDDELNVLDEVVKEKVNNRSVHTRKHKKTQPSVTYLLSRGTGNSVSVKAKGHHASPRGEFSVRGHFRHYKNGNVVWIEEYKKGTGKRKDKVYKI